MDLLLAMFFLLLFQSYSVYKRILYVEEKLTQHIHERDDGSIVKMVGIAHTTTPHNIIYDTVQESLR